MDLSPSSSPPSSSSSSSPSVIVIALIAIVATGFLLVSYYIFVIKCCLNFRGRNSNHDLSSSTAANYVSPCGNQNPKGLEEEIIRSIPVIKFRKLPENENREEITYECAVCLSEFEEGERVRVIPNCCHGFHIDCIDIWLQNNSNCPLCRYGISSSSIFFNQSQIRSDNFCGNDEDYVVIEIQGNNFDEPRLVSNFESEELSLSRNLEHVCSMGDEWIDTREKDEEFKIQPIRRSISMDFSGNREFFLEIQGISKQCSSKLVSEDCSSSSKVRRSIFSFGYGKGSTGFVRSVHLDP